MHNFNYSASTEKEKIDKTSRNSVKYLGSQLCTSLLPSLQASIAVYCKKKTFKGCVTERTMQQLKRKQTSVIHICSRTLQPGIYGASQGLATNMGNSLGSIIIHFIHSGNMSSAVFCGRMARVAISPEWCQVGDAMSSDINQHNQKQYWQFIREYENKNKGSYVNTIHACSM